MQLIAFRKSRFSTGFTQFLPVHITFAPVCTVHHPQETRELPAYLRDLNEWELK